MTEIVMVEGKYLTQTQRKLNKNKVYAYIDLPASERLPLETFLRENKISRPHYYQYRTQYSTEKRNEMKRRKIELDILEAGELDLASHAQQLEQKMRELKNQEYIDDSKTEGKYDSFKYLSRRTTAVDEALIKKCEAGDPQALKLFYQLMGRFIEKKETLNIHYLEGDDYYRIRNQALREIEDGTETRRLKSPKRVREVQPELSILLNQIRLDSGQGDEEDSEVATVGLSS